MGLGNAISRGLSVASSSNYEPSHRSGSTSARSAVHPSTVTSRTSKPSTVRASTITSATTTSKLIRSASESRESVSPSVSSTVRPPTYTSRTSKASTVRASTVTSATSTSTLVRSASTASTARPPTSSSASSITNIPRSGSKRAPSYFSTTASRLLWGRPPPGHSTLQPSQIASLTHTLSLPIDTPMLSSLVGALSLPLSRSQSSHAPKFFCNAHFWLEQKYIDELTEVIAHEIGPQLDKLRIAPKDLISKKTQRLLSILQPYKDIFASITDTSSIVSMRPSCPCCTLSHFFQNPEAVKALSTCVKGRKHRAHPWPGSMAWLEPCPGKGVNWEAKWKTEGKSIGHDRVRVQRWRRDNRVHGEMPETPQIPGHQPGEGCDFCDALRMEQADEAELDAAIAEEMEVAELDGTIVEEAEEDEGSVEGMYGVETDDDDDASSGTTRYSDSETLRAMEEESIINAYERPTTTTTTSSSTADTMISSFYSPNQDKIDSRYHKRGDDDGGRKERARRASQWARSYQHLVGRRPHSQTTLLFERFPEGERGMVELRAGEGGWI